MIRSVMVLGFFGGAWWLLLAVGGAWFRGELVGPVALVWWLLLVILPLAICACILIPERLRTVRLIDEVPVEVHNHLHLHQHNHLTVNYTDASTSQHLHLHGGGGATVDLPAGSRHGLGWRSGHELGRTPERRQLEGPRPSVVPGQILGRARRR